MPVSKPLSSCHLQHAKYAIIIEEDLDVSPDFFRSVQQKIWHVTSRAAALAVVGTS